jgi:hypothetical protein
MGAVIREKASNGSPVCFLTPEGKLGRVWLGHDKHGKPKLGDDRHWRHTIAEAFREQRRPQPTYCLPQSAEPEYGETYKTDFTGALQGDGYPLTYDENGYPELPSCLDRRKPALEQAA